MLDLHNYNPRDIRRIAQIGLSCAAVLLILDAWLFYLVYESADTATPNAWHDFWLPVLTNLVSSMVCVLVGFGLFFRSTSAVDENAEKQNVVDELATIKATLASITESLKQPEQARYSLEDVLAILGAFTKNNKEKDSFFKSMSKNMLNAPNTIRASITAEVSNDKNKTQR